MVYKYRGYDTVDGFWDTYHLEFQDVYDRFSLHSIFAIDHLQETLGFERKRVLDIGGGTGLSALRVAQYASHVVSIEPFAPMRTYAVARQRKLGVANVEFLEGVGEDLSRFADSEFDCAVSVAALPIVWEDKERTKRDCQALIDGCRRVIRPGGFIAIVDGVPGWTWDHVAKGMSGLSYHSDPNLKGQLEFLLEPLGFVYHDIRTINNYGSVEETLATYGFIYGKTAIDYVLDSKVTKVSWMLRVFYRVV